MGRSVWVVEWKVREFPWTPVKALVEKSDAEAECKEAGYYYYPGAKPKFRVTEYVPKPRGYKEEA